MKFSIEKSTWSSPIWGGDGAYNRVGKHAGQIFVGTDGGPKERASDVTVRVAKEISIKNGVYVVPEFLKR
jgi:hypothetical protein